MARTKQTRRKQDFPRPPPQPIQALVVLKYDLMRLEDKLEEAAAVGDVAGCRDLLSAAASRIAASGGNSLTAPSVIHLASMSPVPAAVECLVAAGASVLEEDNTVPAWEATPMLPRPDMVPFGRISYTGPYEAGPLAVYGEDHKQHNCLLLAGQHSPSRVLDMLPVLVRITLQQAKQQQQAEQEQQQQQHWQHQGEKQQQQQPWADVMYKLVKAPMACRPRRAALVLQQVAELEGVAAATTVVERLVQEYAQLRQDSSSEEEDGVMALTHLAQVLLMLWLGVCWEVVQQQVALVTPLQQACGGLLPRSQQAAVQQAEVVQAAAVQAQQTAVVDAVAQQAAEVQVQQAAQVTMPPSWGPIRTALGEVVAATVAAFGEPAGSEDASSSADEGVPKTMQQYQDQNLGRLVAAVERVVELQATPPDAASSEEQLYSISRVRHDPLKEEEQARWAAADALPVLLDTAVADGQYGLVEAAGAGLCRALLAAWLGAQEQLRQERVEGVVGAVQAVAAGKCA